MKTLPFTPGPWTLEVSKYNPAAILLSPTREAIARIAQALPDHPGNAKLIAAAPDLFEALERASVTLGGLSAGMPIAADKLAEVIATCDRALVKAGWRRD